MKLPLQAFWFMAVVEGPTPGIGVSMCFAQQVDGDEYCALTIQMEVSKNQPGFVVREYVCGVWSFFSGLVFHTMSEEAPLLNRMLTDESEKTMSLLFEHLLKWLDQARSDGATRSIILPSDN